jgi:hypothetical protein
MRKDRSQLKNFRVHARPLLLCVLRGSGLGEGNGSRGPLQIAVAVLPRAGNSYGYGTQNNPNSGKVKPIRRKAVGRFRNVFPKTTTYKKIG